MAFDTYAGELEKRVTELEVEIEGLRSRLANVRKKLEEIVCTDGCDRGVVLLSDYSPTHYDPEHKCQVYDHENFSALGDALIEAYEIAAGPAKVDAVGGAIDIGGDEQSS